MEGQGKDRIVARLRTRGDGLWKMVLSVRGKPDAGTERLDPAEFPSRAALREAEIARRQAGVRYAVDEAARKLKSFGIVAKPVYTSRSIVVEGEVAGLTKALDLPEIEDAVFDFDIELIDPEIRKSGRQAD